MTSSCLSYVQIISEDIPHPNILLNLVPIEFIRASMSEYLRVSSSNILL